MTITTTATTPCLIARLWNYRQLILQLVKREVIGRYRGSIMGLAWSFLTPLLMLAVYTTFFTVAYSARIGTHASSDHADFAIVLFAGLIIHGLFAECINRAPSLLVSNVNYVKKVVFPLEILPVVAVIAAVFHALVSLLMLLVVQLVLAHSIPWTVVFFPLILLPFLLMILGGAWFLAALGVYVRDISYLTGLLATVLLFLSPVFYAVDTLPARLQPWIMLNPLTFIIEQSRNVLLYSKLPDWQGLGIYAGISIVVAFAGYWAFRVLRKGFADVL